MSAILLFLGNEEDKEYAPHLKPAVGTATVFTLFRQVNTLAEVIAYCKQRNITGVISTNTFILMKLLATMGNHKDKVSLNDYQGSLFKYQDIEFVFISPLKQLFTVPYGKFISRRFISKLVAPELWKKNPEFSWEVMTASNYERLFAQFQEAIMIGVDIETEYVGLRIDSISYTALFLKDGKFTTHSAVLELNDMFSVAIMRKFNAELKAPKALQNGKYDISYLFAYNAPLYNYLWDTKNMFHCWYAELPKDLAFIAAFLVRDIIYWKDLAKSPDKMEQLKYNALDTYTTVLGVINWILEAPDWAKQNYRMEFPVVFPLHMSEMIGIKRDMDALVAANKELSNEIEEEVTGLSRMLGLKPGLIFNVNSPPQVTRLRKVLGCADIDAGDEKALKKVGNRHPLNARITNRIIKIREKRKLISTYLPLATPEEQKPFMNKKDIIEGKEYKGRILYSINPDGTETGRANSSSHHFGYGHNIQNIPTGDAVKKTLIADNGFRIAECDLKQAESRDTGYLAGEENLIAAVTGPRDFHSVNASAFFGKPYEVIYSDKDGKTLDKKLRDLAKRTNHGANYLMGEGVMVDTMGEDKVWEAKRLLNLPKAYGLKEVAHHLLESFHATYSGLRKTYYPAVVHEIKTTKMIRHHAVINEPEVYGLEPVWNVDWELEPMEGWTRYCFGDPEKNKLDKNSYVAHVSQGFNARKLNVAYLRVFYEIALNPKYYKHFKLCAQIHDSILFQFRDGHEYLADMVRERMEVTAKVLGYDGKVRTYTVPADIKAGKDGKGALRWSETE